MTRPPSTAGRASDPSALDRFISKTSHEYASSDPIYLHLAQQILHNLMHQHDWTELTIHTHSPLSPSSLLPRPLISGLPPHRVYIHPDEQIELLKARIADKDVPSEREWVLPSHLQEKWTLRRFASIFDAIDSIPPNPEGAGDVDVAQHEAQMKWRMVKRALLATVDSDSTIVYYVIHDGIVKPRQN